MPLSTAGAPRRRQDDVVRAGGLLARFDRHASDVTTPSKLFVSIEIQYYIHTISHQYEYTHPISISIFKRLSQLDLEIYEIDHQERIAVDRDVASH
jgi:hypothetical protein